MSIHRFVELQFAAERDYNRFNDLLWRPLKRTGKRRKVFRTVIKLYTYALNILIASKCSLDLKVHVKNLKYF